MHRAFVHLELNTDDVDRARDFYRDVLGWSFNSVDVGKSKYVQIATPKPPGGGIQVKPKRSMSSHWMPYVLVEDVMSTVKRARRAGGKVIVDRTEMPGFGVLAIMSDPTGATFAVWEVVNGKAKKPVETTSEAAAPVEDERKAAARQRALERKQANAQRRAELKARRAAAKEARRLAREERRAALAEQKRAREEARAQREAEAQRKAAEAAKAEKGAKKGPRKGEKKVASKSEKRAAPKREKKVASKSEKRPAAKKAGTTAKKAGTTAKKAGATAKKAGTAPARKGKTARRGRR